MKKRLGILAAGGLAAAVMAVGGTALAASSGSPVSSTGVITGCYTAPNKNGTSQLTLQNAGTSCPSGDSAVSWGEQGPAGPTGAPGATGPGGLSGPQGPNGLNGQNGASGANGANGANGVNGTNGTNGTNGSSDLASKGAPTGSCTPGDTDIELVPSNGPGNGEVWTCNNPGTAWTDTGSTIQGPTGPTGATGTTGTTGATGLTGAAGAAGAGLKFDTTVSSTTGVNENNQSSANSGLCPAGDVAFFDGYQVTYAAGPDNGSYVTDAVEFLIAQSALYTGGSQQGWQLVVGNDTLYNVNVEVTASCWTES